MEIDVATSVGPPASPEDNVVQSIREASSYAKKNNNIVFWGPGGYGRQVQNQSAQKRIHKYLDSHIKFFPARVVRISGDVVQHQTIIS